MSKGVCTLDVPITVKLNNAKITILKCRRTNTSVMSVSLIVTLPQLKLIR